MSNDKNNYLPHYLPIVLYLSKPKSGNSELTNTEQVSRGNFKNKMKGVLCIIGAWVEGERKVIWDYSD